MVQLLLPIIYISFISLGLPDSLLGSAWPSMYPLLGVPFSYAGILSMIISLGTIVSSLNSDRLTRALGTGRVTALSVGMTAAALFGFSHEEYITFLPKSITTAIGMGVSEELGGIVSITAGVIIITGVLGNILAEVVLKVFRITEPVAKGIALGTSAHAIGTAKAMELGEAEGAMSSLSIAVSGIITVAGAALFANLY